VAVTGVALHQDIIELALQKHATVRVRILPGNHDPEISITLQIALAAFYSSNPMVIVELDPSELSSSGSAAP
jgi:pantothenate kinase-related protein Tda10